MLVSASDGAGRDVSTTAEPLHPGLSEWNTRLSLT